MKAITFLEGSALPVLINNYKSNIPEGYSERVDYVANIIKQINDAVKKIKLEEVNLVSKRRTLEALSAEAETMIREEMSSEGMCEMQGVYIKYTLSPSPHRLVIEDERESAPNRFPTSSAGLHKDIAWRICNLSFAFSPNEIKASLNSSCFECNPMGSFCFFRGLSTLPN